MLSRISIVAFCLAFMGFCFYVLGIKPGPLSKTPAEETQTEKPKMGPLPKGAPRPEGPLKKIIVQKTLTAQDQPDINWDKNKDGKVDAGFTGIKRGYHNNGKLNFEIPYKAGKIEGLWKSFYQNGQPQSESWYKKGKSEGGYKSFYQNGLLKSEGTYKSGKPEGAWKTYHENRALHNLKTYKESVIIGIEYFYGPHGALTRQIQHNGKDGRKVVFDFEKGVDLR